MSSSDSLFHLGLAFSGQLKMPLWHWQQMMIFMLANTIACIVVSVSLKVVEKKQVSMIKGNE